MILLMFQRVKKNNMKIIEQKLDFALKITVLLRSEIFNNNKTGGIHDE